MSKFFWQIVLGISIMVVVIFGCVLLNYLAREAKARFNPPKVEQNIPTKKDRVVRAGLLVIGKVEVNKIQSKGKEKNKVSLNQMIVNDIVIGLREDGVVVWEPIKK